MRTAILIAVVLLACCTGKPAVTAITPQVWILPLAAQDSDPVCVITVDYPGRRCTTAGEVRSYLRSVKAD